LSPAAFNAAARWSGAVGSGTSPVPTAPDHRATALNAAGLDG